MALVGAFVIVAALAATAWVTLGNPSRREMITIAVAPIRNQGNSSDALFADGLTQEVSAALTRVDRIAPRPYSSVITAAATKKDPLELGRELSVDYVLQATLRRSNNQLRLVAELIRVKDGTNAWSPRSFQGSDADLFQMQDSIAKQLTHELANTFVDRFAGGRGNHKPHPDAYKLYLQAHAAPLGSQQAVDLYKAVVERDPKFADGWAALARAYDGWAQVSGEPPSVILARKTEAINRALSLDSLNGEAWIARASTTRSQDWDYERADAEYKRAIRLVPTSAWAHMEYAQFLHPLGRTGAAKSELDMAKRLDPANSHFVMIEGYFLQANGRLAEADSVLQRALALDPRNWVAHLMRAKTALKAGKPQDAVTHMEAAQRLQGPDDPFTLSFLAYFSGAAKQDDKARAALARLTVLSKDRYVQRAWFAIARLGLGDSEGALMDLEASATLRESDFMAAMWETATMLWNEPRYQQLVRRAKLNAYWPRPPRV
jgi:TolB-like protein/Flp pilus assembly protein TadD